MANKLAQFEVIVKMKELEIHVKGDRQVGPEIADNVGQHISGMIQTAGLLEAPKNSNGAQPPLVNAPAQSTTRKRRKATGSSLAAVSGEAAAQLTWNHDQSKWGTPLQTWKSYEKCAWLLRIVEQALQKTELNPSELAEAFNTRFKAAGLLIRQNIGRDLGKKDDLFGSVDGRWFLKEAGKTKADELIVQAKGSPVAPTIA